MVPASRHVLLLAAAALAPIAMPARAAAGALPAPLQGSVGDAATEVARLLDVAGTPAAERRTAAASLLSSLPRERVLDVEAALGDPDAGVRAAVCELFGRGDLGALGRPERVGALGRLAANDTAPTARKAAIRALGAIGDGSASASLAELALGAPDVSDRIAAARALADAPSGGPPIVALVRRALGGGRPAALADERVLAALLPRYAASLAGEAAPSDAELAPLLVGLRHPGDRVRLAAERAFDDLIARLARLGAAGGPAGLLERLSDLGLDPSLALYHAARLALVAELSPERARARAAELIALRGLRLRPSARIDAYESQLWLFRGLLLSGAADLAAGTPERAARSYARAADVLDRGLAERRDLSSGSERRRHADLLQQRALCELHRVAALLAADAPRAEVLERARVAHATNLEAQALGASLGGAGTAGLDDILFTELGPQRLLLGSRGFPGGGLDRDALVRLSRGLGRALATVAPGEMPGFVPFDVSGLAPDRAARLTDPLRDPDRRRALEDARRARLDGLDDIIDEAEALLDVMARRSLGLLPEEELVEADLLRRQRAVLQQELEQQEPGDRAWIRDLRVPSSAALVVANALAQEGRADEARRVAERMRADLEEDGISRWWTTRGYDLSIRAQLLVGSALTDAGEGEAAEAEILEAAQRIEDLERDLENRGATRGELEPLRQLLGDALVSLAVNANVRLGDADKANEYYERAYEIRKDEFMRALLACYRARAGRDAEARGLLRTIQPGPGTWYNLACTHALLGDTDRALDLLEEELTRNQPSAAARARQAAWAREDPDLASLRGEPRFERLTAGR